MTVVKGQRVRLPSRGDWIHARMRYWRDHGVLGLQSVKEAAADWDEGRPVGDWDYHKYASGSAK